MIEVKNVSFAYPKDGEEVNCLKNISFRINAGEVVVFCGKSGCGKTSVTRLINGLIPHFYEGTLTGEVTVSGQNVTQQPLEHTAKTVGSVFQNPRSQFFNVDTTGELVFGCENIALPKEETQRRMQEAVDVFDLEELLNRSIFELSGGEKQRIACASVYMVKPDVFVFDEPSSNLDRRAIELLRSAIEILVSQNKTVIIAEHRLHYLTGLATRYMYMEDGHIAREFSAEEMLALSNEERIGLGLRSLQHSCLCENIQKNNFDGNDAGIGIQIEELQVCYDNTVVLNVDELSFAKHSIVAIIGENGAGKSTFAKVVVGLQKDKEKVFLEKKPFGRKKRLQKSYMVMQDVNHQLFTESVLDEVELNVPSEMHEYIPEVLKKLSLDYLEKRHPQSLSGGQKQRVAIAGALCAGKEILIYDEPTSGQDYEHMQNTCEQIKSTGKEALCSLVITHDVEFLLECCDRVIRLEKGVVCEDYSLDDAGCKRVLAYFENIKGDKRSKQRLVKKKSVLSRLMAHAGNFKYTMMLSWLFSALSGLVTIGTYIYLYRAADSILYFAESANAVSFGEYGVNLLFIASSAFTLYCFGLMFSHITSFNLVSKLRKSMVEHLAKVPLGYYALQSSGALRKTLEKSTENTENFVAHQLPDYAQSLVMPVAFLASMFYFDWRMSLLCLIPIVLGFMALGMMMGGNNADFIVKYQKALGDMSGAGVEYVRGMSVVKIFGQSVHSFTQFHKSIMDYRKFALRYVMSMKNPMSLYISAVNGIFFFILPAGIVLYQVSADPGRALHSFVFFIIFSPLVATLLMRIMNSTNNRMLAEKALDDIDEILATPLQKHMQESGLPPSFDIEFKEVDFTYTEQQELALKQVSFTAKAGTVTALVGASGSGKTTITNLIARFWDDYEGKILIGGKELKTLDYDVWLRSFSFVFQDSQLLKLSIADNVAFCADNVSEEDIKKALHLAQCDDIIEKLPNGIHTVVGTKGVYLSGGEMQRLAIARAILQDAPIVLLDEATAFADPENEHLILKALSTLLKGKTVLMIAHRLSVITTADNILVLEKGEILEAGNHRTLLNKNGLYAAMFKEYSKGVQWRIQAKKTGEVQHA